MVILSISYQLAIVYDCWLVIFYWLQGRGFLANLAAISVFT